MGALGPIKHELLAGSRTLRNMMSFRLGPLSARGVHWHGPAWGTEVQFIGSGNDRDPILVNVGSATPNNVISNAYSTRDVNLNGQVKYTGTANDRDPILVTVGSNTPNNTVNDYSTRDVNMDGTVKYTGSANDRDPILVNVGSTTPNSTRLEQIP